MVLDVLLAAALTALPQLPSEADRVCSLDGAWDFALLDSNSVQTAAGRIDVPSSWELRGYGKPRYDADISGEVGVYRRRFTVPRDWAVGDRIYLRFDGVQFGAEVCLNGQVVGDFTTSFNAVCFEATEAVRRSGENELVVRTHGHPKGAEFDTNDDWTLHGIHRSVTLFALPPRHIVNWRLVTKVKGADAAVSVSVETSEAMPATVELLDANGERVGGGEGSNIDFVVRNARFWTAETPTLHTLVLRIPGQEIRRRVGLREVTWADGILRLNGRPIELRGINHHDLSPVNGRAITAAEQRRDVGLIVAANCNFIRTSHYPPSEALLDACDELGVYVMDEVPFGGGKKLVEDASYGPCLLERARLTVERDVNRASVIAWSVGNEQKVTPITLAAEREVRRLDPTRPTCFPQQPNYFEKHVNEKGMAEQGDILNWHYPLVIASEEKLAGEWFPKFDRPFVSGEFAHANGLDFGYLEDYLRLMRRSPSYAGGAVWMFQDQGIMRNREDIPDERRATCVVTRDGIWYDSCGCLGTDGVVYADRTPQADYAELQQAYSPVQVGFSVGAESVDIVLSNHLDFVALDEKLAGTWRFVSDHSVIAQGELDLRGIPGRGTGIVRVPRPAADGIVQWLDVTFRTRKDGRQVFTKTCPLAFDKARFVPKAVGSAAYSFALDEASGGVRLLDAQGRVLVDGRPLLRTDRRRMLGKDFSYAAFAQPWSPKVLAPASARVRERTAHRIVCDYVYEPTNAVAARVDAEVAFDLLPDRVRVSYALVQNVDRKVFETGLAFAFRQRDVRFEWVGLGPYETYPGTTALSNFGVWSLGAKDLRFVGNRHGTRLLRLWLDGSRLAVVPRRESDFAFERTADGVLFGSNAHVGRKGCRFALPYDMRTLRAGERLEGSFDLMPQTEANGAALDAVFGSICPTDVFQPFVRSYDD